jgi:hypothetical protein
LLVVFLFAHGQEDSMAGSRGKKDVAYQALRRLIGEPGDLLDMISVLFEEDDVSTPSRYDDRAAAIVFAAMVERALETAIATHFAAPTEAAGLFSGPIEEGSVITFSAKIALGSALGVFDQVMRKDLMWTKNIRNTFAHSRGRLTFETEGIKLACSHLTHQIAHGEFDVLPQFAGKKFALNTSRKTYTFSALMMCAYLETKDVKPLLYKESKLYSDLYLHR